MDIIIETPKGSIIKYDAEPALGTYRAVKPLPVGLAFPFDFGFIPGTKGEDGDPLDVVILSEFSFFSGCSITCRIVGCIQAQQGKSKRKLIRNDRYLAIPEVSLQYATVKTAKQIPLKVKQQLALFFEQYNRIEGKTFKITKWLSARDAVNSLKRSFSKPADPTYLVQLLLPLRDNAGNAISRKYFDACYRKLVNKFGGVTVYSRAPVAGAWIKDNSQIDKDQLIIYEVMTGHIDVNYWSKCKSSLEQQFKQQQIIVRQFKIGLL